MAKKVAGEKMTVKKSGSSSDYYGYHWVDGTNGNDTITVIAKKYVKIGAGKGHDIINIKKGNSHIIYSDEPYASSAQGYGYGSSGNGKDKITISGGKGHSVYAGRGADKIYVKKGGGFSEIYGNEGNDTITVYKGAKAGQKGMSHIVGGKGKDKITVNYGKNYRILGGVGNDIIKITGGSKLEIADSDGKKNSLTVKKANDFKVDNFKGAISITGGKNGDINSTSGTVTVNSGNSHRINSGSKSNVQVKGGTNLTLMTTVATINGGSGKVDEDGTCTITVDFTKDKKVKNWKIGNWDIMLKQPTNNRLTIAGATSKEFEITRAPDTYGLLNYVRGDYWILKHKPTGATISLSGWSEYDAKTFDIFFKKDNMLYSSKPAQTNWEKAWKG